MNALKFVININEANICLEHSIHIGQSYIAVDLSCIDNNSLFMNPTKINTLNSFDFFYYFIICVTGARKRRLPGNKSLCISDEWERQ